MTGIGLGDPELLRRYAHQARATADLVPVDVGPRARIDPGPGGELAEVIRANDVARDRWLGKADGIRRALGGNARAAEYIAVEFPKVDQYNADALHELSETAMSQSRVDGT